MVGEEVNENCEPLRCPTNPWADATPGVNWSECNLIGAVLYRADLSGANLYDADLSVGLLWEIKMSYTDLRSADLRYAILQGADLGYADLTGADLTNAFLEGVLWGNTTCPDGSNSDTNGLGYCTP